MNKVGGFFNDLQKSTKITLLSCACMVMLTLILMLFFIFFPITPSEKVMSTIGRESSFKNNDPNSIVTALPGAATTSSGEKASSTTKAASTAKYTGTTTTRTNYKINITTGTGFLYNGRIPTGVRPGYDYDTQAAQQDYSYSGTSGYVAPTTGAANNYDPSYVAPSTGAAADPGYISQDPSQYDPNSGYSGGDTGNVTPDPGYSGGDTGNVTPDPGYSGGDTGSSGGDSGAGAAPVGGDSATW